MEDRYADIPIGVDYDINGIRDEMRVLERGLTVRMQRWWLELHLKRAQWIIRRLKEILCSAFWVTLLATRMNDSFVVNIPPSYTASHVNSQI